MSVLFNKTSIKPCKAQKSTQTGDRVRPLQFNHSLNFIWIWFNPFTRSDMAQVGYSGYYKNTIDELGIKFVLLQ